MEDVKCPHCNIELVEDDTYRQSIDENCGMVATFYKMGHCPECDRQYQWEVCYDLENPLINGLGEV